MVPRLVIQAAAARYVPFADAGRVGDGENNFDMAARREY